MVASGDGYAFRPTNLSDIKEAFEVARQTGRKVVLRGAGRSYGDAAIGDEAIVLDQARRTKSVHFFGLNPGLIQTKIRANMLGEGSFLHTVVEFGIGLLMPSADDYARRIVPVLFARELEGRTGVMFGAKGNPILPSEGMTESYVAQLISASQKLVTTALK